MRYADDIVVGFEHEADARRFWDAMQRRFEKFALSLNPDKTRLIEFGRHAAVDVLAEGSASRRPSTSWASRFICGRSRSGKFLIKRKSRRDRMRTKLKEIKEEMQRRRHQPIPEQGGLAGAGRAGLLCLPRRADQRGVDQGFPSSRGGSLAPLALAT